MSPKTLALHALVEKFDDWIKGTSTWKLWAAVVTLGVIDSVAFMIDLVPLLDEVLVGGIAIKIGGELLRRRELARKLRGSATKPAERQPEHS